MQGLIASAVLIFALFSGQPTDAATAGEPAYRTAILGQNSPWQEGLLLEFAPDERQCQARYGRQWQEKCATSLGRSGDTVTSVKLSPAVPGHWQWRDGTSLVFLPEEGHSLSPNTTYSVNLENLYRPASTIIDRKKVSLATMPLAVRMTEGKLWIDPSPKGAHRLAASLEFNYPLAHEPGVEITKPHGARFGQPESVWNRNRDQLNISWPVNALPENVAEVRLVVRGMGEYSLENGNPRYYAPNARQKGAVFGITVPGTEGLFQVKSAKTRLEYDKNLDRVHILDLETSLYAKPDEVAKRLRVLELPRYNSKGADRPYNWQLAPAVPAETLKNSKKLEAFSMQKDNTPVSRMSFRIPAQSGRYLLVALEKDCPAASGLTLAKTFANVVKVDETNPVLGFLQPGNILPLVRDTIVDIYASGLDKVSWQAQFVRHPFLAILAGSGGEAFEDALDRTGLDMAQLSESSKGELALSGQGNARFAALDLGPLLEKNRDSGASGLLRLNLKGYKDGREAASASRMILATDIGLLAKRNVSGGYECFAYSLKDGQPLANAKIGILGANGKLVAEKNSDSRGHVSFSPAGSSPESRPVAVTARNGRSLSWLPLQDRSRELNFSEFPVGGTHSSPDGLNSFVFSERGLYRPGETLRFGCITRRADFELMPADMPLQADLADPLGRTIFKKDFVAGKNGMATIEWAAPREALSGLYTLNVRPHGSREILGYFAVRLEEFQPDTLKLHIGLPKVKGWLRTGNKDEGKIVLNLRNLYGSPAAGHKVRASLLQTPALFRFQGFEDYVFTDAAPLAGHGVRQELPAAKTDAEGNAVLEIPSTVCARNSALLNVLAEGFEAGGGRATASHASILASPLEAMLGYKPIGSLTNLQFIPKGQKAELYFLALNPALEKTPLADLSFSTSRRRYVTSLIADGLGGYRYDETPIDVPLASQKHSLPENGMNFDLPTNETGEYLLNVQDAKGRLLAQIPFAVAGTEPLPPNSALCGGKIRLRLDKKDYKAGDKINLALSLPYDGTGLVTIERDGVEAFEWFTARAGDATATIEIPEDFEGRGYVGVTFARSTDSPDIYVGPLAYAVAPFTSNIRERDMGLALKAPRQIAPGENLRVNIAARQPGQAVVFAVDEGILQLSNFRTPAPLEDLLLKRALDVKTLQALDLLMPDHARMSQRISAFGGGLDGVPFGARFQNPFRRRNEPPVVFWSGLVDVGSDPVAIDIPIPDYYNGKLRVMAAGAAANGAGSAADYATVVAPLVITPQIPVAVAPGDSFDGALVLANTSDQDMTAKLDVILPDSLELQGKLSPDVKIPANREIVLPFNVAVRDRPGAAEIRFALETPEKTWRRKASLSVRPQSPLMTTVQSGWLEKSADLLVNRKIYPQMAHGDLVVSAMPLPLARGFAEYLNAYPYGCTEQLVSKAFAQALLKDWPGFAGDRRERDKIIEAALGAIRSRFNGNGVALWPDSQPDKLLTIYAADFLLALRENGIGCPEDLLEQVCDAVEAECALNEAGIEGARKAAYALWVLTRQGRITTQLIENLLEALDGENLPGWKNDITAMLISASQREMHIRNPLHVTKMEYSPAGWFDEYALASLHLALLARYLPEVCTNEVRDLYFEATTEAMNRNIYATFSASQGIRALMALNKATTATIDGTRLSCPGAGGEENLLANGSLATFETAHCGKYRLDVPEASPRLYWQIATTGFDSQPAQKAAHGIEISRSYLDRDGNVVKSVVQGDEVTVKITARAMQASLPDCVISDLLPGGFEMIAPKGNNGSLPESVKFADRREDRMLLFADLTDKPLEFAYRIRAVNPGKFGVAPISASAMYAPAMYGNGATSEITVTGE